MYHFGILHLHFPVTCFLFTRAQLPQYKQLICLRFVFEIHNYICGYSLTHTPLKHLPYIYNTYNVQLAACLRPYTCVANNESRVVSYKTEMLANASRLVHPK